MVMIGGRVDGVDSAVKSVESWYPALKGLFAQAVAERAMCKASASGSGTHGSPDWFLRVLGGFELSARPGGSKVAVLRKRERVVLAYLALSPGCRTSPRKLTALL